MEFDLVNYLSNGVEKIIKSAMKATIKNPRESLFLASFYRSTMAAGNIRKSMEEKGEHIPPFLIASITSVCNLHCKGCYARANHACGEEEMSCSMTSDEWGKIFKEAEELGISFVLLAGGEPLMRKDILKTAADYKNIMFPIFTNGTMFTDEYIELFHKNRNLVPIVSLEGREELTNRRRGEGVYQQLVHAMDKLQEKQIIFGASVTVTKDNLMEVTNNKFLNLLYEQGCKVVIYVEYVPMDEKTSDLAPGDLERDYLNNRLSELRNIQDGMVFISFPGDEKSSGGCLAAGRGFFHINASGGAEPCPFSPYSDVSVKTEGIRKSLQSTLFCKLQSEEILLTDHVGGCVLFEQKNQVEAMLKSKK